MGDVSKYAEKVRAEWTDGETSQAWRKWHRKSVPYWKELTDALVEVARLRPGWHVLDLAGGTGDPALTLAGIVGPSGKVVSTDISPGMVEIAKDHAREAGLGNITFEIVDAHQMPFPGNEFDCVTCRLGVMFFWDCQKALRDILRVLKPGGVAAFVAWGPAEQNEYMRAILGPFKKRKEPPAPPPDAPTPYRFAKPGSLSAELRTAGFADVTEETRTISQVWHGPPEEGWQRQYEISAPMRPYFNSFSEEDRKAAIAEVIAGLSRHYDGKKISTRAPIIVAAGLKPAV